MISRRTWIEKAMRKVFRLRVEQTLVLFGPNMPSQSRESATIRLKCIWTVLGIPTSFTSKAANVTHLPTNRWRCTPRLQMEANLA
eukprot:1668355-Pyramimonas_sp.AAC.1